jgi:hypothetical protein
VVSYRRVSPLRRSTSRRLDLQSCRTLPTVGGGELVGILTWDNAGEFLMFQSAFMS